MPASSIATNIRASLETALSGIAANVYDVAPEAPIPPFAAILPDSPYMEIELIGRGSVRVKLNLIISVGVAYLSNAAALDNFEKLTISILAALPSGYELSTVGNPSIVQIGNTNFFVGDIRLSTRYEQTS
jgi:hypothetical protein